MLAVLLLRWRSRRVRENFLKYKLHELFIIILQTKVKDGKKGAKIIKNPFDIVQLTLQLFAPLTKQMEVANFIFPFFIIFLLSFSSPATTEKKRKFGRKRLHRKWLSRWRNWNYLESHFTSQRRRCEVNFFNSFWSNSITSTRKH